MTDNFEEELKQLRRKMIKNIASARLRGNRDAIYEAGEIGVGTYSAAEAAKAAKAAKEEAKALGDGSYYGGELVRVEVEEIRQKNKDRKSNRKLRQKYATSVMRYLVGYSVFVAIILMLNGFNVFCFQLPENVLVYLVGSTAAAAIGLVFAVTNGLFKGISA